MEPTIRLPNGQRAQRRRAQGALRLVRLLPAIPLLHLRELAVKILQLLWEAAGLAMFYFWGCSLQGERRRLEAKIDRLLSEHGIGPAQFHYQEEEGVQAEA